MTRRNSLHMCDIEALLLGVSDVWLEQPEDAGTVAVVCLMVVQALQKNTAERKCTVTMGSSVDVFLDKVTNKGLTGKGEFELTCPGDVEQACGMSCGVEGEEHSKGDDSQHKGPGVRSCLACRK